MTNPTDTNQASEDKLRQELRKTLLDKLAIIKYGEAYKWLFDVDKSNVDLWTKDLQALISDREKLARIDELERIEPTGEDRLLVWTTGNNPDMAMTIDERIKELREEQS